MHLIAEIEGIYRILAGVDGSLGADASVAEVSIVDLTGQVFALFEERLELMCLAVIRDGQVFHGQMRFQKADGIDADDRNGQIVAAQHKDGLGIDTGNSDGFFLNNCFARECRAGIDGMELIGFDCFAVDIQFAAEDKFLSLFIGEDIRFILELAHEAKLHAVLLRIGLRLDEDVRYIRREGVVHIRRESSHQIGAGLGGNLAQTNLQIRLDRRQLVDEVDHSVEDLHVEAAALNRLTDCIGRIDSVIDTVDNILQSAEGRSVAHRILEDLVDVQQNQVADLDLHTLLEACGDVDADKALCVAVDTADHAEIIEIFGRRDHFGRGNLAVGDSLALGVERALRAVDINSRRSLRDRVAFAAVVADGDRLSGEGREQARVQ